MEKILSIDTSNNKEIKVALKIDGKEEFCLRSQTTVLKSQAVLLLIDKLLKGHAIKMNQITSVNVNLGPGSFTGVRVGVAVANTLGFALKIPVNNKNVGEIVEPLYNN